MMSLHLKYSKKIQRKSHETSLCSSQLAYNNHLKPQTNNSLNCTNSFTRIIYALYRLKTSPYFQEENISPMLTYMYMS